MAASRRLRADRLESPEAPVLIVASRWGLRAPRSWPGRLAAALGRQGRPVEVWETASAAELNERLAACTAKVAAPFSRLVAAGGDGTVRSVGAAAHALGVPLAIAPWGTGNYLADELRIPRAPDALARIVAKGRSAPLAFARANGEPFLLLAGVGLDAAAVAAIAPRLKSVSGTAAYADALTRALLRWRPQRLSVRLDGAAPVQTSWFAATNARLQPSRLVLAQAEAPRLHALLINAPHPPAAALMAMRFATRSLAPAAGLVITPFTRALVTAEGAPPVQLDGDLAAGLPLAIAVDPRPLAVLAPGAQG